MRSGSRGCSVEMRRAIEICTEPATREARGRGVSQYGMCNGICNRLSLE